MAVVANTLAVRLNVNGLAQFDITINQDHLSAEYPKDYFLMKGEGEINFHSATGNFTYDETGPIGGTITSIYWDTTGSIEHKISGISVDIITFLHWIENGQILTALKTILHGADTISGSNFADILDGFGGNDRITGRGGADHMTGGPGKDTFVFRHGFGRDVVTDFSAGPGAGDVIEMHGKFGSLAQVKAHSYLDAGNHLVIVVDASDTITLSTVHSKASLSANDFHFLS